VSRSANLRYAVDVTTSPLAAVLGTHCRRIRKHAGITQDDLAKVARQFGLKWTASKVRDFESGRSAPTFATVLALTAALNCVRPGVRLADLVSFDGEVTITGDFEPTGDQLAEFCGGGTWENCSAAEAFLQLSAGSVIDWSKVPGLQVPKVWGLTEERVAAGLGISTDQLCEVSLRLWDNTFSAQRDRIAGPDASAQRKGRVTRQLKGELERALADGNG